MWCGTRSVTAALCVLAVVALVALPAHTPPAEHVVPARIASLGPVDSAAHAVHPLSCKPVAPFSIEAAPIAGSAQSWTLVLANLDEAGDFEVWMGPNDDSRRRVWSGRLESGIETRIDVTYAAPAGAERLIVALEPTGQRGAIVRGVDIIEMGARIANVPEGRVVDDPTTGRRVRQFQGVAGGSR